MSTGAEPTPAAGGPKSALKIAVPLVALVGVVFGVTYITQYTPPKEQDDKGPVGGPDTGEPPLRFFTSTRHWDPPLLGKPGYREFPLLAPSAVAPTDPDRPFAYSPQNRVFQGFYEPSQSYLRRTQFWFENRNPNPVLLQLKGLSCSSCTGGRVAAIPPATANLLFRHTALAALPVGPFNPFGVGLSQPLAALVTPAQQGEYPPLQWTEYGFEADPNATFRVPAGADAAPQWGILELKFKATAQPGTAIKPLHATFATQVEGTNQTGGQDFLIAFEVARAFDLSRTTVDVGRLDPLSGDREYEVIMYSATRGPGSEFGDLDPPVASVEGPGGVPDPAGFVELTRVERLAEPALADAAERLATENKRMTKLRAAYRLTVTVRPKVGDRRLDIGLMERNVNLTAGGASLQLTVKGTVRGAVWLDGDRTEFELTRFRGGAGVVETVDLTTETPGVELAVVAAECEPKSLKFELERQPDRGGRGYYKLRVTVPPGQVFGTVKGVVILEVKGPNPQRMRIPFKGTATL